jgi:hypothetical protein
MTRGATTFKKPWPPPRKGDENGMKSMKNNNPSRKIMKTA